MTYIMIKCWKAQVLKSELKQVLTIHDNNNLECNNLDSTCTFMNIGF